MSAPSSRELGRRALSLGAANVFEYGLQFLMPLVLVRALEAEAFGQYRLLWLAAGTLTTLLTLSLPGSLYFYLPRADAAGKRLYIHQTLIVMLLAGALAAWTVSDWNPWLPEKLAALAQHGLVVPAFVLLWIVGSVLDMLPTAEERIAWQARAVIGLAALRAIGLSLAAVLTGELAPVLAVLLVFVLFKVALLAYYLARFHGLRGPYLRWDALTGQVRYAAPFGAATALYSLRMQSDQWVAAALFSVTSFAAFSIGALLAPMLTVLRRSVNYVFLPNMSRRQAAGDLRGMIELNRHANVMVGALAFPILAFAFVFTEDVVTLVFTSRYLEAAPVMRVYIVGLVALVVELAGLTFLLQQGPFVLGVSAGALAASLTLSLGGALTFGLAGAALGSTAAVYFDLVLTLRRIARRTGVPVREVQDWRALGTLLGFSVLAALLAGVVVQSTLERSGALVHLLAGGVLLVCAYAALAASWPRGRRWIMAAGR